MPDRKAEAMWNGDLKSGNGNLKLGSGMFEGAYSFVSRFEDGEGTNPEELIAAAHAGCYSMALSNELAKAGHDTKSVDTKATITLEMIDGAPTISKIKLNATATVPGLDNDEFQKIAEATKDACPVSRVLNAQIILEAELA
ncbi:MAG: OsmC family protein [Balneolaceae bacterium]|nr:OsmC family protein [Balneolaceae bacterium]